jgi:lipopolysaccharide export system protein LptA
MSMTRTLGMAVIALTVLAAPATGDAQTAAPAAPAGSGAVSFGADGGEYTSTGIALRGRAEVVQGLNRLRANAIDGTIVSGDLTRVEASGDVYFVTPDQTIRGDRAVYTFATDEVVVSGDVILTQGENVLTGGRLVYNTRTESARMEGGSGSTGGRIRGVFYPASGGN